MDKFMEMCSLITYLSRKVMFKRYLAAVGFVAVLIALGLLASTSVAEAQQAPSNFNTKTVPFFLACSTPTGMRDTLLEVHGEIALVAGWLDTGNQWLLYTNEMGTSMSFVVHKTDGEACLIWSGISTEGRAFVPNPEPMSPSDVLTDQDPAEERWNQ